MIKSILSVVTGSLNPNNDRTASASFTANGQSVEIECSGLSTVGIQTRGTFVAQMAVQGLTDPSSTSWETILAARRSQTGLTGSITATNQQYVVPVGGLYKLRVIVTSYTSGTVELYMNGSSGHGVTNAFISGSSNGNVSATQAGIWSVSNNDSQRASYSASIANLNVANNGTDFFTITGSGTSIIRIMKIVVDATQNTAGIRDVLAIKRSTANTGGTSTTLANVSHDSSDPAGSAVVRAYTANPTLGTAVGQVRAAKIFIGDIGKTGSANASSFLFFDGANKAMELRTTSEVLALNFNSQTAAGNLFNISIEWTESST